MPLIWLLLVALLSLEYMLSENSANSEQASIIAENEVVSESMQIYKNAIVRYVEAAPSASGAIPNSSLSLPSWYSHVKGVSNYVTTGKVYVYYAGRGDLASVIVGKTESMTVGVNRGGMLINPRTGSTGIVLPTVIPESSVVIMQ
ncbi:type IV pilus biogenesis protein PilM [Pseudomonas reactans]|uniref:type IV pilus biogenesis protein PilM n=1 Tax=Pseudomonas reactans TaxID=117680 RepID=UPI0015A3ACF8|nr:type IV pilus biogenesis protein PilM [Pseudomonas reactans]NWC90509.1 type IV pilus biogenesis protein PilM [Pseudomonas reactans]